MMHITFFCLSQFVAFEFILALSLCGSVFAYDIIFILFAYRLSSNENQ